MKNILVIGGSSGIGRDVVKKMTEKNCNVFASFNTNNEFESNTNYFQLDVIKDELNLDFLPDVIDGVVYCPGSINLKPFKRISPKDFTEDFELQVVGAIKVIQSVLKKLDKSENASIVLFSTVAVKLGFNFHTQVASSKGAIEGLTKSLAAELSPNIRVNCIAPSLTKTPLSSKLLNSEEKVVNNANRHPLKRIGNCNDISSFVEFLLSENSSWITGQVIQIDGGISSLKI